MHRIDGSNYFLFIEPDADDRSIQPIDDDVTRSVQHAMSRGIIGTSRYTDLRDIPGTFYPRDDHDDQKEKGGNTYRGFHIADDGSVSDTFDYRLPNGYITHSLCVHYVRYYRHVLPPTELEKLYTLHGYMVQQRQQQQQREEEEMTEQDTDHDNTEL